MDRNHRDELDQILDRGLAEYSSREPLAGLEDRVLNRIRAEAAGSSRSRWWGLAFAATVLAALVIVAIVSRSGRAPVSTPILTAHVEAPPQSISPPLPPAPAPGGIRSAAHTRAARPAPSPRVLPKRDQFPTLRPLSPEERALISLAQTQPAEAAAVAELQRKNLKDIEIPPLEIQPLRTEGDQ